MLQVKPKSEGLASREEGTEYSMTSWSLGFRLTDPHVGTCRKTAMSIIIGPRAIVVILFNAFIDGLYPNKDAPMEKSAWKLCYI